MLKVGETFGISDELIRIHQKKTVGEIKKYLCYQGNPEQDKKQDYRMTGIAYEICDECKEGKKECSFCTENCEYTKKYFIKCIDIVKLRQKMNSLESKKKGSFQKSPFYVHLCCMEKERQLADQLRDTLIPAYLVPPRYLFDLNTAKDKKMANIKGSVYPYRGKDWDQVMRECKGSMKPEDIMLLKESAILQLLYAIKSLHDLPGNYVHRDLKPANLTIEKVEDSYSDGILLSIIDWDWVCIGNDANDPFADFCGGTSGFAHPRSFKKNDNSVLSSTPSKRWDYYSAALTIFYMLEGYYHFGAERYWDDDRAYVLKPMPNTERFLDQICSNSRESRQCYQALRHMIQKMMGESKEYKNQYSDIQEAIEDYEQYLLLRHGRSCSKYFQPRYLLCNSDFRYSCEKLTRIVCLHEKQGTETEYHYVLAEHDAVTLKMNEERIAVLFSVGEDKIRGLMLSKNWKWKEDDTIHKRLRNQEHLCNKQTGEQIWIRYTQF